MDNISLIIKQAITEEIAVPVEEISDTISLAGSFAVDSVEKVDILAKISIRLGINVMCSDHQSLDTVQDIKDYLQRFIL